MDHVHDHPIHPGHRQGDFPGSDSRVFTCTKVLRDGHRTSMLFVPNLFRVDVTGRGDEVEIKMRNLSGGAIAGGVQETIQHVRTSAYDGTPQVLSQFRFEPLDGPIGDVVVSILRPAEGRGERFSCSAMATLKRRVE
jgi:hypothetical protein